LNANGNVPYETVLSSAEVMAIKIPENTYLKSDADWKVKSLSLSGDRKKK
jgi:hypothetical protein